MKAMREREAYRRANETANGREHRLAANREREASNHANKTDMEREDRLIAMRERVLPTGR